MAESERQWQSIKDYEVPPETLSDVELKALSSVWLDQREELTKSENFQIFAERLKREWSIETGLIEKLYTLDRGITELLIKQGISDLLIPHSVLNQSPSLVVSLIEDHRQAIDSLFSFVVGTRELSTSYIKELHSILTRHQETVEGLDQFGRKTEIPLIHGDYKQYPNNPTRSDGRSHEYCPPIQVASEMDKLISLHHEHNNVAAEVEAAWLHHRFTQIHPFQDGNGRVARALATLVLLKARWLPLVVQDAQRSTYIGALEEADAGNLKALVDYFAKLQRESFIKALGTAQQVRQAQGVQARVQSITDKLAEKERSLVAERERVFSVAANLQHRAKQRLNEVAESLEQAVIKYPQYSFHVDDELNEGSRSHYYRRQIVDTAKKLDYFANTSFYRSWVRFVARDGARSNILISCHCPGHEFLGVLVFTATWFQQEANDDGIIETGSISALCDELFQFNDREEKANLQARFESWLEQVIERGLTFWELNL